MNLAAMAVQVRPRLPFEALDHGVVIARQFARPALIAWLLAAAPVFIVSLVLVVYGYEGTSSILLWWLKPYYERAILFVYSRGVFGATPGWRETLRALPGLWNRGLWWQLTLARFSPSRSFVNPIRQLEGLRGAPLRQRLNSLSRRAGSHAMALMFVVFHLELVFTIGVLALVLMFVPQTVNIDITALLDLDLAADVGMWFSISMQLLYFAILTVLEPIYVAGGFALYLNQRTILEGWDLELGLRRLATRVAALQGKAGALAPMLLAVALGAGLLAGGPDVARAAITSEPLARELQPATAAEQVAEDVLRDPIFDLEETTSGLRLRADLAELLKNLGSDEDDDSEPFQLPEWLSGLGDGVYATVKGVFLVLLAAFVAWLVIRLAPHLRSAATAPDAPAATPDPVSGELFAQALPERPLDTVRSLWQAGETREALALLYRATLDGEARLGRLKFPDSATEREALRLVRASGGPRLEVFRDTTRAWQEQAYAHRAPDDARTVALFDRWQSTYA